MKILLVRHLHRPDVQRAARRLKRRADAIGVDLVDAGDLLESGTAMGELELAEKPDLILALGGDGTILGAAEIAYKEDVPLLGINFGHMGFLTETTADSVGRVLEQIADGDYGLDPRMTLAVRLVAPDGEATEDWALNDAVVLHSDNAHPADFAFAVDGQVVSTYAADGIILATPTGSTAYAFSSGGPVVWPETQAIVMAPLAAHGLFTRPLVVAPKSKLEIGVLDSNRVAPTLWLDGRRQIEVPPGSRIEATMGSRPIKLVRLDDTPFAERLVTKFNLPVTGWRADPVNSLGDASDTSEEEGEDADD